MKSLFIKNMVCNRCIMMIHNELNKLDLKVKSINLGEVVFEKVPSSEDKRKLGDSLISLGFEIIDDKMLMNE